MKPTFSLFGITFTSYSLFMFSGAAVCLVMFVVLTFKRRKGHYEENIFALEMLIIAMAAAIPAAMLFDSLFHMAERGKFAIQGATFYGGLLFAIAIWPLLLLIKRNRKVTIYERLCDVAPGIPLGHCLGRLGCFCGGCCYGRPTSSPFGVVFPEGSVPYQHYGAAALHPTQLYEAYALLVIFLILLLFCKKHALPVYFMLYALARFTIECFRADDRGAIFGLPLSPAQIISVCLFIVGEVMVIVYLKKKLNQLKG